MENVSEREKMLWRRGKVQNLSLRVPIRAVFLVDCFDRGAVGLLAVLPRRHPFVYSVQATGFFKVADLPCRREALDGYQEENEGKQQGKEGIVNS